jgi:glycosyltransferase involved in cell wall biosynthesis
VRISVVIPCHNAAAFLDETLASVQAQTRAADEVIVVDDRSTDGSAEIARARGATVIEAPPPGRAAAARNAGWRHTRGELIAFVDADDRWLPHHLEIVARLLEAHPDAVLAFGRLQLFGLETGPYVGHHLPGGGPVDARVPAAIHCAGPQTAVIIRRDALEAVGGYDETLRYAEDFELFARLSRRGTFISADAATCEYRQHSAQATHERLLDVLLDTMEVRHRNWAALRGELPAQQLRQIEEQARAVWELNLRSQWRDGHRSGFDRMLACAPLVPGGEAIARRWRRRRRLGWHAWYAVLRTGRALRLRRLWNATLGRGAARATGSAA